MNFLNALIPEKYRQFVNQKGLSGKVGDITQVYKTQSNLIESTRAFKKMSKAH